MGCVRPTDGCFHARRSNRAYRSRVVLLRILPLDLLRQTLGNYGGFASCLAGSKAVDATDRVAGTGVWNRWRSSVDRRLPFAA